VPFVAAVQTRADGRPQLNGPSPRPLTKQALEDFFACSTMLPLTVVSYVLGHFEDAASLGAVTTAPSPAVARPASSWSSSAASTR